MGSVKVEHVNTNLLEQADYTELNKLKALYKGFKGLEKMIDRGDMVAKDIQIDLQGCLDKMPDEQREAIERLCIEGYTFVEINEFFHVSKGTTLRRVKAGLETARTMLEGVVRVDE